MSYLPLADEVEQEAVRVALATCFYLACDEADELRQKKTEVAPGTDDYRILEHALQQAELRRMRYSELHDRLLAMAPPTSEPHGGPMSRQFLSDGTWTVVSP